MKVACVGGGPAGLYFSLLMKLRDPAHEVTVHERRPAGATYGWGVTYWRAMLGWLHRHDPVSAQTLREHSVSWDRGIAHIGDHTLTQPGDEGFGIGRHRLLEILADRAAGLGVRLEYEDEITDPAQLPGADLVVAADGVHSALRRRRAAHFGTETTLGRNSYVWLGTTRVFSSFTFAFTETDHGWIWCYAYPFSEEHSTLVFECAPSTWRGLGLDRAPEADGLALLEKLFADTLAGEPLLARPPGDAHAGDAPWQAFRTVTNRTWHHGNVVLLGDAAHTTHYSIGAGTTLALEDAAALADALHRHSDPATACAEYARTRQRALLSVQSAARYSARWYENLPRYMRLPPEQMFALLGQRHSPLLPHVPPRLYHRLDRAVEHLGPLRRAKRRLGPRVAAALHRGSR
ncbi:FAD-dependent monooxygenase [Streptomyces sp. JJ36]|uniref:FAD-dependent monooxygenase n=1 Tax=Streptomyces sp. JJ36 TaxID=2736645 RepID=UPI001F0119BB|nr:FAD-dependent monooxygenase [Streptomyces sp. JJ36]